MCGSCAVGKNPLRIFQIEVDQAGQYPSAQFISQNVVAQIPGQILHLKCAADAIPSSAKFWGALDAFVGKAFSRAISEKIAHPQRPRRLTRTSECKCSSGCFIELIHR